MGKKVAKHGNYAVSSACGSSNVLEQLGIKLSSEPSEVRSMFDKAGICFIHAPLFHPAMKRVASVRKQLGIRTVFNALGPLVNPARPSVQMNGVYSLELQRSYGYLLQRLGGRFATVHSLDGYDEVSLTAPCRVVTHRGIHELRASDFGLEAVSPEEIRGGATPEASALLARTILSGEGTNAQQRVVAANAGLVLWVNGDNESLSECTEAAMRCLREGAANKVLEMCVR